MEPTPDELIPTRATLLSRLKDLQDQASWQDFFDTYWYLIYGVALRGGLTPTEAEDVVQETMIAVVKHMPGFKYDPALGSFKAWLLKLTRWRITDQFRKRSRHTSTSETTADGRSTETETVDGSFDWEKMWDAEWEKNILNAAVSRVRRRVKPKQYQIFDFYTNKQWEPERIAELFSVPVSQVYLAKHRVTDAIKQEVERLRREMI